MDVQGGYGYSASSRAPHLDGPAPLGERFYEGDDGMRTESLGNNTLGLRH